MFETNDKTRPFTRIVEVLQSHLPIFRVDYDSHLLRGILPCRTGASYIATMSFDDTQWLRFFVALPAVDCLQPSSLRHLLRIQFSNDRLSHICFDEEHRELDIRSRVYLPDRRLADLVIPQLIQDVQGILEDDRLAILVPRKLAS